MDEGKRGGTLRWRRRVSFLFSFIHIYIYVFSFPRRANLDDPQVFFSLLLLFLRLHACQGPFFSPNFLCPCSLRLFKLGARTVWCLHHRPSTRLLLSSPPSFFFFSFLNLPTGFFFGIIIYLSLSDVSLSRFLFRLYRRSVNYVISVYFHLYLFYIAHRPAVLSPPHRKPLTTTSHVFFSCLVFSFFLFHLPTRLR